MKKYIRDLGDTKEKVKITRTTCDNESEISDAIKRSREELDFSNNNSIPSEYNKVDEKIITTVYKVQPKDYTKNSYDRSNIREKIINKKYISTNRYESNNDYNTYRHDYNCGQCRCNPKYTERYDVNSKYGIYNNSPRRTKTPYYDGSPSRETYTLYNFNNIARNHGYYETKSRSPSPSPKYSSTNCNSFRTYTEYRNTSTDKYNNNRCYSRRRYDDDFDYNKNNTYTSKYYYQRNRNLSKTPKARKSCKKCCHCIHLYHCCHCNHIGPKRTVEYTPISGGRIENYFENEITQDGEYLVTMSLAKKVMDQDKTGFKYEDENENQNQKVEDRKEVVIEYENKRVRDQNKIKNDNDRCCKRNKRNNYYSEKIEIDKKKGGYKDIEEKSSTYRVRNKDYGDNYRYYERNESRSPLKKTITVQKRRGPVHVYGTQTYEKNDVVRNYRVNLPESNEKKVIRTYKKENSYDDNNNINYDENENNNYNNDYEDYENNYDNDNYDNNEKDYNRYEN